MNYTSSARKVLADLKHVRICLEEETRDIEWRIYWITAIVLLRATGHVLLKVDGERSPTVKQIANELHTNWKGESTENKIFRDFIELERNNIIKEYQLGVTEGPISIVDIPGDCGINLSSNRATLISENIYKPMCSGTYEGEDGRDLIDEAIYWWTVQLDYIDMESTHRSSNSLTN